MGERLSRRAPEAIRSLKRSVYEGGSLPLAQGLATERKWFMIASATDSSQEKMAAMTEQVETEGESPWASAEGLLPWQDGTAAGD
jgi:enoyl-CoA hydratase/carnithine racemase